MLSLITHSYHQFEIEKTDISRFHIKFLQSSNKFVKLCSFRKEFAKLLKKDWFVLVFIRLSKSLLLYLIGQIVLN